MCSIYFRVFSGTRHRVRADVCLRVFLCVYYCVCVCVYLYVRLHM